MTPNPLIPAAYDLAWSGVLVIWLALLIVALLQIRRAPALTPTTRAIWVLVVLVGPVIGPLAWFVVGRKSATA
jgi:hypothetical protein